MKKLLFVALLAVSTMVICGCEKTTEEKMKDAAESAQKDADKAGNDLGKKLDGALGK